MLQFLKSVINLLIYLPVVGITYFIVWLDRKVRFTYSFPRDVNDLSKQPEWCFKELKKAGLIPTDAELKTYKVTPLNQDIIFRSNAGVIEIEYLHQKETKVIKCFAKFSPTVGTVWNRTIFNLQLNHIKETFFNRHFVMGAENFPAPKVYYTQTSILTGNLCLITELMDDCIEYQECTYDFFPQHHLDLALKEMAAFHAAHWGEGSKRMGKIFPIEDSTVHLFNLIVLFTWSKAARKILVKSWSHMNQFQTVIHGDSRIGNMMFPKSETKGRFVFIDWQAVRKGKAVFDLAYFLILSLKEEHRKSVEQISKDTYYELLLKNGVADYSRQDFEDDYNHACLCILVLLSLPLLSGEASVEATAALIFVFGMGVWQQRVQSKFEDFDYKWLSKNYQFTEEAGRAAIAEMLKVIAVRLNGIAEENQ